jgi:hypothetical protein
MKKLLATSALVMIAMSGAASAQSVLERVLGSINVDNTNMLPVTGTFANIAENIAVLGTGTVYSTSGGVVISADDYAAMKDTASANFNAVATITPVYSATTGEIVSYTYDADGAGSGAATTGLSLAAAEAARDSGAAAAATSAVSAYSAKVIGQSAILNNIDGSVTNALTGVTTSTASVNGTVLAIDQVKVDIGNVATTVLGAVNTGTTSLGVNSDYNQAIAGTSEAVSGKVQQLGGMADQTALVLNVASNATSVVGSVSNTFAALNGSVGNIATTVLGAVNTGTISSGVNAASNGIVAGIVGTTTP